MELKTIGLINRFNLLSCLLCLTMCLMFTCQLAVSVNGQTILQKPSAAPDKKPTPTPERPRKIMSLLDDARLAAPELAVDTFLKVIESKKVTDAVWKKEILEEALRITEDVKYPVQLRPIEIRGVSLNNTEAYVLAVAYSQKLDRLSLKSRVITLLIDSDRERAKQAAFEIGGQLGLKRRSCEDTMTYEVGAIYSAVAKVANAVFNQKEIKEGQRALFVLPWIENIESPTQIPPALDLLEQIQGTPAERQMLFSSLSRSISRNFKDDRSFTSVVSWGTGLGAKVGKMVSGGPDPQKEELTLAYRDFLLKNLRDARCKDNQVGKDEPLPKFIEVANKLFPQKPLTSDDIVGSEVDGAAKFSDLANSDSIKRLLEELRPIKGASSDGKKLDNIDQADPAWQMRVTEFVDKLLSLEATGSQTDTQIFHVKAALFLALLESIDRGELRKTVVRKYLRSLASSNIQKASFIEWFYYLNMLEKMDPEMFAELTPDFPNPNFRAALQAKKVLGDPNKVMKPSLEPTKAGEAKDN